jgi:hypothetical protein
MVMNERIKELYDLADKFAKENRTQTNIGPGNNYFELFHEKFAQLIVQKCADIGQQYADGNYEVYNQILEHFGVEE